MTSHQPLAIDRSDDPACTITFDVDAGFVDWLTSSGGSLLVTTYQACRVLLFSVIDGQVAMRSQRFEKPMGVAVAGNRLAMACRYELRLFEARPDDIVLRDHVDDGEHGAGERRSSRVALHTVATHLTGDIHAHDVGIDAAGKLWFINTRFSCLCTLADDVLFQPRWRPAFISLLADEDRCHLNGLAMVDGRPRFVTAMAETDVAEGWRDHRTTGGMLIDIDTNAVVASGFAMPHSPRWFDDHLWMLDSGRGRLMRIDPASSESIAMCELPGYLRGLCMVGDVAVIGMSRIRSRHAFAGLPVQQQFDRLECGLAVVDRHTGETRGRLTLDGGCDELYDVTFLPGVRQARLLTDDRLPGG